MNRAFFAAPALLLLSACTTTMCPCGKYADNRNAPHVTYSCTNGSVLKVAYVSGEMDYVTIAGPKAVPFDNVDGLINLPIQVSASGFKYSNGVSTLRGKGNEVYWQPDPMSKNVRCQQRLD